MWMQLRLDFFSNGYGFLCFPYVFFSDVLVVMFSSKSREKTSKNYVVIWLVVWNMIFMTFHILGIVAPTDELIFFSGVGQPPTSCISTYNWSPAQVVAIGAPTDVPIRYSWHGESRPLPGRFWG